MNHSQESDAKHVTWSVWRQDDHGNEFLVRDGLSQTEAEQLAAELESHGHKQLYWVQQDRST